jgi:MFS family permease
MSNVSVIGMALYLLLSVAGGLLTGVFAAMMYHAVKDELGKLWSMAINSVFFIAPAWALFSLSNDDDLQVFYLLLIVFFGLGLLVGNKHKANSPSVPSKQRSLMPDDED